MNSRIHNMSLGVLLALGLSGGSLGAAPDLILHGGKIVTVDEAFSIHSAMAVEGERIVQVGEDQEILELEGSETRVIDLAGKVVLPGLIDSHVHPGAAMTEFDHRIPRMESIGDVLEYIRGRAAALEPGEWIYLRQVFITRLKEQRYPTRDELDEAAPENPVVFSTGPDAMLDSLALERLGIDADFEVPDDGPGHIERDPETGEPTGMMRGLNRLIDIDRPEKEPTEEDRYRRARRLFEDYNSVGLTTVSDRSAGGGAIDRYQRMRDRDDLTVRMALMRYVSTQDSAEEIRETIEAIADHPLRGDDPLLRLIGVKTFLDGGMLTGSAYMREPWGVSEMYGISDPSYRGVLHIPEEKLRPIVEAAVDAGLQFTAHSVGDGAVHRLLETYEQVNETQPIAETRPCITHSNFMSREAVQKAADLGVVLDIQPPWLYLDARTLIEQFGYDRLRYFQPLKSIFEAGGIVGGGSDHMQKIGAERAVNPYDPFLGMWIAITREARWIDRRVHPEEALSREQALRLYTINNAHLLFLEDEVGSLEPGKLADWIIVDRDVLTCPVDDLKETRVLATYLAGERVWTAEP